jgi:hypothetical protein
MNAKASGECHLANVLSTTRHLEVGLTSPDVIILGVSSRVWGSGTGNNVDSDG